MIHHNNIIASQNDAKDYQTYNTYDYEGEGNYWNFYTGSDNNGDGIGDTPYNIEWGSNQDRYPLMSQVQRDAPIADFTWTRNNKIVNFIDASIQQDGSIVSWEWEFDDGQTSSEQNPSHSYIEAGVYTVTLQVFNSAGGVDTETKTDYITVTNSTILINDSGDKLLINDSGDSLLIN